MIRSPFLKGVITGLIAGIIIMLLVFFLTPFGARYATVNKAGPGIYMVDQWTGDVWSCYGSRCVKSEFLP